MTYLIGFLLLALIGCAVTIYRLSGEKRDLAGYLKDADVTTHYLRQRNKELNAELLTRDVRTTTHGTSASGAIIVQPGETITLPLTLPAEHPQKRPKSIRGKRK